MPFNVTIRLQGGSESEATDPPRLIHPSQGLRSGLGAPASRRPTDDWASATGLAEEVRRHGHWVYEEAEKRIGHSYISG